LVSNYIITLKGNGYDSMTLAKLLMASDDVKGKLVVMDIQKKALDATLSRLLSEFSSKDIESHISFVENNHRNLTVIDQYLPPGGAKAFVYNLGYLPGGDKGIFTLFEDTIVSLKEAALRTAKGGLITVTCYRGHEGGREETEVVRQELAAWEQASWRVCEFVPLNWRASPIVFTAHRFEVKKYLSFTFLRIG